MHGMLTNLINMSAYNFGMLLWLWYSAAYQKNAVLPILVPQRWDEALTDLRPQNDAESLIPMFEHMVDRAFSKVQDSRA